MKRIGAFIICAAVGIGIGWYIGYTRPVAMHQREVLRQSEYFKSMSNNIVSGIADFNKLREEYARAAKPYEASSASIALAALKDLDTNDLDGARSRLAGIIATYYRNNSSNGDTNLLTRIEAFASEDRMLSNALYQR